MGLSKLKSNLAAFKTGDSEYSAISTVDYFDDFKGGAKGFVAKANDVNKSYFVGLSANNDAYTYPSTVIGGRLMKPNGTLRSRPTVAFPGPQNYFDDISSGAKGFTNKMYPIGGSKQDSQFLGINGNSYTYSDTLVNKWKNLNLRNDNTNVYKSTTIDDQPFILRGMQRPGEINAKPQRWGFGLGLGDGLIRGGAVTAAERAAADSVRIAKWMASPKGLLWIVKQVGLGLTNPKVETIDGADIGQTRVHLGVPTLLSVAGSAFGLHFPSHGIPFATEKANYEKVQIALKPTWNSDNRLIKLLGEINPEEQKEFPIGTKYNTLSGVGGSRSVYGVVRTDINRAASTTNLETSVTRAKKAGYPSAQTEGINSYITLAYGKIPNRALNPRAVIDFRSLAKDDIAEGNDVQKTQLGTGFNETYYQTDNLDAKYGYGNLGTPDAKFKVSQGPGSFDQTGLDFNHQLTKDEQAQVKSSPASLKSILKKKRTILLNNPDFRGDRINAVDIGNVPGNYNKLDDIYPETNQKDIIKFFFEDGAHGNNVMVFRASIIGLSENFSPGWNKVDILGRPEGAYLYNSFERTISFEFKVYAFSRSEMIPMWRKLNYLASYTMPDYSGPGKYSGPLMRLTLGDMYYRMPGFMTSLTYTIPDEGSWDIANDFNTGNQDPKELPMYIDVSVSYTIIGNVRPRMMGRVYSLSPNDTLSTVPGQWLQDARIIDPVPIEPEKPKEQESNTTKTTTTTSTDTNKAAETNVDKQSTSNTNIPAEDNNFHPDKSAKVSVDQSPSQYQQYKNSVVANKPQPPTNPTPKSPMELAMQGRAGGTTSTSPLSTSTQNFVNSGLNPIAR